mmetsp:Transcript_15065/g.46800  ORF Transcript_15065/g.46800 Transcript_15065/m.46800 type:complete len:128 (-) Transcript_15065:29-412(-)
MGSGVRGHDGVIFAMGSSSYPLNLQAKSRTLKLKLNAICRVIQTEVQTEFRPLGPDRLLDLSDLGERRVKLARTPQCCLRDANEESEPFQGNLSLGKKSPKALDTRKHQQDIAHIAATLDEVHDIYT